MKTIPFNKPYLTGNEFENITNAHEQGQLAGDGSFTKLCHAWLEENTGCRKALLTHSCTAALEMSAMLLDIRPGDEIIVPSYTFVSSANAFVSRGAVPVFVDIRKDTLNLDEELVSKAITSKTKAIVPVHYAGVGCTMKPLLEIAKEKGLYIVEDAAQGICASYNGEELGSMGDIGCLSFHETKNIHCGEGGAILLNNEIFIERAEIIREKGTNRSNFFRGEVSKYQWIDIGSSYLPGELTSAFLYAQLQDAKKITKRRLCIWNKYHESLIDLEKEGKIRRPITPNGCKHNGHIYYLILGSSYNREEVLRKLNSKGISAVFHYKPLHNSPAGLRYGRFSGSLTNTDDLCDRIIRLPLWIGFDHHDYVLSALSEILN